MAKELVSIRLTDEHRAEIDRLRERANKHFAEQTGTSTKIEAYPTTASFVRALIGVGLTEIERRWNTAESNRRRRGRALERRE